MKEYCIRLLLSAIVLISISCTCKESSVRIVDSKSIDVFGMSVNHFKIIKNDSSGIAYSINIPDTEELEGVYSINKTDTFHIVVEMILQLENEHPKCDKTFLNRINLDSYRFTADKLFVFDTDTILPDVNLLTLGSLNNIGPIIRPFDYISKSKIKMVILNSFFTKSTFFSEKQVFKLEFDTDDDIHIEDEFTLFIE